MLEKNLASILRIISGRRKVGMPHKTRPMAALVLFIGLNAVLVSTIEPVYDFVCFLPFWERRRERRRQEREAAFPNTSSTRSS